MNLAQYLTKFSDYWADNRIPTKDIAIQREFMEPFKWDYIQVDRTKLGNAADLLTNSLSSKAFWSYLKKYHSILAKKYIINKTNTESISDIQKLQEDII